VPVRDRGHAVGTEDGGGTLIGAMMRIDARELDPRQARRLSRRQAEVLDLVRGGATTKEIAARLGIGEHAVKGHISRLLRRFGVQNRAGLVATADRARTEVT